MEWSTKTYDALSLLIGTINRRSSVAALQPLSSSSDLPALEDTLQENSEDLQPKDGQTLVSEAAVVNTSIKQLPLNIVTSTMHMTLKVDISNINVFVCDSAGGELSIYLYVILLKMSYQCVYM